MQWWNALLALSLIQHADKSIAMMHILLNIGLPCCIYISATDALGRQKQHPGLT